MKNLFNLLLLTSLVGFFVSCQNAPKGEKVVAEAAKKVVPKMATKTYKVDGAASKVSWSGSKATGTHTGTLNVTSGNVDTKDGKVVGGTFNIDMNSLACTDLEAGKGKEKLEGHLKSPDFFNVAANPTSTFTITNVNNGNVTGNLTMMGVTKSITFPATIGMSDSGVTVSSNDFTINRTDFGMKYGSASFFDNLKDKAINDKVGLKIQLKAS